MPEQLPWPAHTAAAVLPAQRCWDGMGWATRLCSVQASMTRGWTGWPNPRQAVLLRVATHCSCFHGGQLIVAGRAGALAAGAAAHRAHHQRRLRAQPAPPQLCWGGARQQRAVQRCDDAAKALHRGCRAMTCCIVETCLTCKGGWGSVSTQGHCGRGCGNLADVPGSAGGLLL